MGELGRRRPPNFEHVAKYPYAALAEPPVATVERILSLPSWHWTHDQRAQGSCVGHGGAMERAITNTAQNRAAGLKLPGRRYDPLHIWNEAKRIDPWPDTNPGDDNGTSVSAAYDVLRDIGPQRCQIRFGQSAPEPYNIKLPLLSDGVVRNRWTQEVDEARAAIASGVPVVIGVDWHTAFDRPIQKANGEWWLPTPDLAFGQIRGGHCVCIYGASDRRQAFKFKNSWGKNYPLVWIPYETLAVLIDHDGEVCVSTDR